MNLTNLGQLKQKKAFWDLHDRLTWTYRPAAVVSIAERFLVRTFCKPTRPEIHQFKTIMYNSKTVATVTSMVDRVGLNFLIHL